MNSRDIPEEVAAELRADIAKRKAVEHHRNELRLNQIFMDGRTCPECPNYCGHDGGRGEQRYATCDILENNREPEDCPELERKHMRGDYDDER